MRISATVLSGTGGVWRAQTEDGSIVECSIRGRLKIEEEQGRPSKTEKLAVGDRVDIESDETAVVWTIVAIHERHSRLSRRAPGKGGGERTIVANLDQVLVVFSAMNPDPHPRMLDRFLVIAESNDLTARIVVNKCDLVTREYAVSLFDDHHKAGYDIHYVSARDGTGMDDLHATLKGQISAFAGPSGVGKSSLMNAMFPGLEQRVSAISESVNKGRHTTVGALLHPLPGGGYIADTPGLREIGLWGIAAADVARYFPELRPLADSCRFNDCLHDVEPGCAIRDAVDAGIVSKSRWQSALKLRAELESNRPNNTSR